MKLGIGRGLGGMYGESGKDQDPQTTIDERRASGYNSASIHEDAYRLYPAGPEGHWRK
jgi:hypothetical protein